MDPLATLLPLAQATAEAGVPIAFAAGIVSFLSPCVLPLVPGYLAAVSGVRPEELGSAGWRRVLVPALLFIASFSLIFILLGLTASGVGGFLRSNQSVLRSVAGIMIAAMGVLFVAAFFLGRFAREWRVDALMRRASGGGPLVAGAAFGVAWTPCIGPTLAAVFTLAALEDSMWRGAGLLAVYSAGLAVPFLLTAVAFSRMTTAFAWVRRHYSAIIAGAGVVLIATGVLVYTGEFFRLNIEAQNFLRSVGLDFIADGI